MSQLTIDGKPVRKVYNEKRITMTAKTPDGKTVTTKSTGVDAKGLHYATASDFARLTQDRDWETGFPSIVN